MSKKEYWVTVKIETKGLDKGLKHLKYYMLHDFGMILAEKQGGLSHGYKILKDPENKYLRDTSIDVKKENILLTIKLKAKDENKAKKVVDEMIEILEANSIPSLKGRYSIENVRYVP